MRFLCSWSLLLAEKLEMDETLPYRSGSRAGRERNFEPQERICLKNERKSTNQCDAQTEFFVHTGLQPCVGGGEVMCCDVMWLVARWGWLWGEVG